jgi:hypothetical protein
LSKYLKLGEEQYLLLKPDHVDLKDHIDDVDIMGTEDSERLGYFRDVCLGDPDYWVAHEFDY